MAMGSTGTINITPEMMNQALNVISEYRTTTTNLKTELEGTVSGLIPSGFSGNAAEGFKTFYTKNIEPAVDTNMTQLLDTLQQMMEAILNAIPQESVGLDDQLADGNSQINSAQE